MRIGYDGKFLWQGKAVGSHSGHGVQARALLRSLIDLDDANEYVVYLLHEEADLSQRAKVHPVLLPRAARSSAVRNTIALPFELRRHPVDVLLSFSVVPLRAACPTILILDDLFSITHPEWLPRRYAIPHALATRASVRRAGRIVTATEFMKRELVQRLGVSPGRIDVVPFGIRSTFLQGVEPSAIDAVKGRYGISQPYVLSINDMHPRKNLHGLVKAFGLLKARTGVSHCLVLAGRALWDYPSLTEEIATSPYRDEILVIGYVQAEDLNPLYRGASLFVYPSFYEGWGLQVHEAMCARVPVAVSEGSAMAEIAGGAALEFDPHDPLDVSRCIERALSDPALCSDLVERGLKQVGHFSWEDAARRTLEVCREAADS